jgi:hypothetical protein
MRVIIGDRLRARVRAAHGEAGERALDAMAERLAPHLYFLAGRFDLPSDLPTAVTVDSGGPDFTPSTLLAAVLDELADNGSESRARGRGDDLEASHLAMSLQMIDPDQMLIWYNPYAPRFGSTAAETAAVEHRMTAALTGVPGAEPWGGSDWEWTLLIREAE